MTDITVYEHNQIELLQKGADKHTRHRVKKFLEWHGESGRPLISPDLAAYRDHLIAIGLAPATVSAHLSTVRSQYERILTDNDTRQLLFDLASDLAPADRKAFVDETLTRLSNAIDPKKSTVKTVTRQDRPDSVHIRLTKDQAEMLMNAPGLDTLIGLRNTAIIAIMLCTGIREAELSSLDVDNLHAEMGGELALHILSGKGCKERLIPYGALDWCLAIVDKWLQSASITAGPVFRGLYKANSLRPGRISVRAIEYIVTSYPITIRRKLVTVRPHDLRRTYARRLYESGVDLMAIRQNMGHSDQKTTQGYIGALDVDKRRAPAIYSFDLSKLRDETHPKT